MYDNLYQTTTCKAEVMPLKVAEAIVCSLSPRPWSSYQ